MNQSNESQVLKKTYIALKKTQKRVEELENAQREPLAIIGMACRFPGGGNTPEAFWDLLKNGVDASSEIPEERWKSQTFYHPEPDTPGTTHAHRANFLTLPIDEFDAPFFNISAKEARAMDPQQRLLMEVSWEAMEDAGLNVSRLNGSRTGVYVGISSDDYSLAHRHSGDYGQVDAYSLTGTCFAPAAGRLSYSFGFEGPSMAVDTACSSSLVALHLACRGLRNHEMDMALVGGVNLILTPSFHICSTKLGTISPDGRCKTFDASADGYGRGEGCGMVVIKRLSDAVRDEDPIHAVIRGTEVNQDGKSNGLTAPNGRSQEKVIRSALANAGLSPADINYVEAHGTGTSLGDPIEVEAIARVMEESHTRENPVWISSVKINIGHLEAAAGISGLFKVILSMRHDTLPPHFHFKNPNPYVDWEQLPVEVPTQLTSWQRNDKPRRAGISSFGFSGTNAHVVVEEPPSVKEEQEGQQPIEIQSRKDRSSCLLPLSARSENALKALAKNYVRFIEHSDVSIADICHTAGVGRTHFNYRISVIGKDADEIKTNLEAYTQGKKAAGLKQNDGVLSKPKVVFLFTGQGSQYVGMGKELYDTSPVFRDAMDACDAGLRPYLNESLLELLYSEGADDTRLTQTQFTQPAIFAIEYALAQLWMSWGVIPDKVAGHSIGEYAAACIAGVMSLEDTLRLVAARGRLMQSLPGNGTMAAVFAREEDLLAQLDFEGKEVSIAAVNAPGSVVLSGERGQVQEMIEELKKRGISAKQLNVSHAFHSPLMDPILDEFRQIANEITYHDPEISIISTVRGGEIQDGDFTSAEYWTEQIRKPVRFCEAGERLSLDSSSLLLEIGAMPILAGLMKRIVTEDTCTILYSMKKGEEEWKSLLHALGEVYIHGIEVGWRAYDQAYKRKRVSLPFYAFQRKNFYMNPVREQGPAGGGHAFTEDSHPYLGERIDSPIMGEDSTLFQALFSEPWPDFLRQHKIFGKIISPGAAHLCMALSAWRNEKGNEPCVLENVDLTAPLVVDEEEKRKVQLILENKLDSKAEFRLLSKEAGQRKGTWILHCNGNVHNLLEDETNSEPLPLEEIRTRCDEDMTAEELYQYIENVGYSVGPLFQCVREIHKGDNEALCIVRNVHEVDEMAVYPGLVDSFLQTVLPALMKNDRGMLDGEHVLIPLHFKKIQFQKSLDGDLYCHTQVALMEDAIKAQIRIADPSGNVVLEIEDFLLKYTDRNTLYRDLREDFHKLIYLTQWDEIRPREKEHVSSTGLSYSLVLDDGHGFGQTLVNTIRTQGGNCIHVLLGETFEQKAKDTYVVNANQEDDLSQIFHEAIKHKGDTPIHLLCCLGIKDGHIHEIDANGLEFAEQIIIQPLLSVFHQLHSQNVTDHFKLWCFTEKSQRTHLEDGTIQLATSPLWGLGRTMEMEFPEMWGGMIDVDANLPATAFATVLAHIEEPNHENQIAVRQNGRIYGARLIPMKKRREESSREELPLPSCSKDEGIYLDTGNKGTLDELNFKKRSRREPQANEVEVHIYASGLNFRDVLNVLGQYPGDAGFMGYEAAGIVTRTGSLVSEFREGDGVIVMDAPGCICDYMTCDLNCVMKIPAGMNFYEAVTLPATFLTAYYALEKLGHVREGDKVLIHAGAGGVGMAAVQLCLDAGAEVFATAGSDKKRALLKDMGVHHVMNSRTLEFADEIHTITQGQGVDVVLNSLSGDFIEKSFEVLAKHGRFLEMGKIEIWNESQVRAKDPSYSYYPFDLSTVSRENPGYVKELFHELLPRFESQSLTALPYTVFPMRRAKEAFRYMAQAKHIGKIVLSRLEDIRRDERETLGVVRSDATYLITGGLGALGLQAARWLAEEGAQHIVLTSRSDPKPEVEAILQSLQQQGIEIEVMRGDVAHEEDVQRIIQRIRTEMPPLKGILHAAGVLDDGMLGEQTWERFKKVMAPKVRGAWNLHRATRNVLLDFFVMYSSVASLLGNLGQSNYAAANAFMDSLAHYRRQQGLPALSVNWGPWAEAGMAAGVSKERFSSQGIQSLNPERGMHILNTLLTEEITQPCVIDVDWAKYAESRALDGRHGFFSMLLGESKVKKKTDKFESKEQNLILDELKQCSDGQRKNTLVAFLKQTALDVLGYSETEQISTDQPLVDQGFDSLMSVEMRNRLGKSLNQSLPASLLFDYPTLEKIAEYLLEEVLKVEEETGTSEVQTKAGRASDDLLSEIDELVKS